MAGFCPTTVLAQLYFVTGSQTPKSTAQYPTVLFVTNSNGEARKVEEIASGTWRIEISYEERKLVALSPYPESKIAVLDFDKGMVSKRCEQPKIGSFEEWVADVPGV